MSGQFGAFCGLDNRKELMILLTKLGDGVPEQVGRDRRAAFLNGLVLEAKRPFRGARVPPCTALDAYHYFVAVTGVLGVNIETAARKLDQLVRSQ